MITDDFPLFLQGLSSAFPRARLIHVTSQGPVVTIHRVKAIGLLKGLASAPDYSAHPREDRVEINMLRSATPIIPCTAEWGRTLGDEMARELHFEGIDTGSLNCIICVRREGYRLAWGQGYEVSPAQLTDIQRRHLATHDRLPA